MNPGIAYALGTLLLYGLADFVYKCGAAAGAQPYRFLMVQTWFFTLLAVIYGVLSRTLAFAPGALWGAAAIDWHRRNGAIQINHMVTVSESLAKSDPAAVREVYRLLAESRKAAGSPTGPGPDMMPVGLEANRRNLEVAIEYVYQKRLVPRRFSVDELFDDTTRALG